MEKVYKPLYLLIIMPIQLKQMKGREFVTQVLYRERDFQRIELEEGFDLSGYDGFNEMQTYLKKQDFKENPLDITDSKLIGIIARKIYLPYVKGIRANLDRASLYGANLDGANLDGASLRGVENLKKTLNLGGAYFFETRVTKKEREIIEEALKKRQMFIVE